MKKLIPGLLALVLPSMTSAAEDTEAVRQRFIGNYELVSYVVYPPNGQERDMNYVATLTYDRFGNMAGIGMPRDLPQRDANSSERLREGFAYWGTVSFEPEYGRVIHHVQGSPMAPQWVGGDNIRYYEFEDDLLKLSLKDDEGRITATLTWRRLR